MTESLTPNADVYTKYINQLGVENLKFVDVFGLDYELLLMVPLPVYAVLLLFRFTDKNMGYDTSHHGNAEEDQFETPSADQKVNMQCVTFVHEEGALYGMDGKNDGPIKYGNTIEETLLQDAAEVIKRFIDDRDPDEHQYIVMALVKK